MSYPSDLADEQWDLLQPVLNAPGKRGRKHGDDLRTVVDAMLYVGTGSDGAARFRAPRGREETPSMITAAAARRLGHHHDLEFRRVGWDDKQSTFRPIRHAWRVEVTHGRLGRSRADRGR